MEASKIVEFVDELTEKEKRLLVAYMMTQHYEEKPKQVDIKKNGWTSQEKQALCSYKNLGMSYPQIATKKELQGRTAWAIAKQADKLELIKHRNKSRQNKRWRKNEDNTVYEMHNNGVSNREIAKKLNRSTGAIDARIKQVTKGF